MRPLVIGLLILLTATPLAGCKRRAMKGTATAPRAIPPTAESIISDEREKLRATLEEVPLLMGGVNYTDPATMELWERFPNGMMFREITRTGERAPALGQKVTVAYTGTVYAATQPFDAASKEKPMTFHLGTKDMIKGFNMGVATMRLNSKRRVFIPPEFGYGEAGNPRAGIGSNNPLVFDIELLKIEGEPIGSLTPPFTMPEPMGPNLPETSPATHPDDHDHP